MNRMLSAIYKLVLLILFLASVSAAVSVSLSSVDGKGASSVNVNYDVDHSSYLAQRLVLGNGWISSSLSIKGSGSNKIDQTAGNEEASVSSSIDSIGALSSTASGYASADIVQVGQNLQSAGQSDSSISGGSGSVSTAQNAGVLEGYMTSSQIITAGSGTINALQATNLAGTLGYADGVVQSSDNIVHMTSGLNGAGGMSGFLSTTASDGVRASGSFQAESLESKTYSAVKSISPHADAYTYISSAGHLESSMSGSANGHVTSNQEFDANGDVRVYASCTSDDSPTKIYDVDGESVSGSISASAGSPAVIDTDLVGDLQSSAAGFIPTPGSLVWNGFGGVLTSNPYQLLADDGTNQILSDPFALQDEQGKIHIITSDAMPTLDPFNPSLIHTSVRGSDGTLWYNTLDTTTSWVTWTGLGGYIDGNPAPVIDTDGVLHYFVRGGDGGLWDNAGGAWYNLGGFIKSNPNAIRDMEGKLHVAAVGGDDGLWVNTVGIDSTPTTLVGSFACDYDKIQAGVDSISEGGIVKGAGKANTIVNCQLADSGCNHEKKGELPFNLFFMLKNHWMAH
jgi:hypothetical protein